MKRTIKTMIAVLLVGTTLTGCGTIKPPQLNNTATTVTTSATTTSTSTTTTTKAATTTAVTTNDMTTTDAEHNDVPAATSQTVKK